MAHNWKPWSDNCYHQSWMVRYTNAVRNILPFFVFEVKPHGRMSREWCVGSLNPTCLKYATQKLAWTSNGFTTFDIRFLGQAKCDCAIGGRDLAAQSRRLYNSAASERVLGWSLFHQVTQAHCKCSILVLIGHLKMIFSTFTTILSKEMKTERLRANIL